MSWGNLLTEKVVTSADGKTWTLTEPQAVARYMYDTQLDAGFRIHRVDGVREAFQTVDTGDEDIVQAAVF